MKKLLALLLALTLVFSMFALSACGNKDKDDDDDRKPGKEDDNTVETLAGKTPQELYADAQEQLSKASSFIVDTKQVIVMTYDGEKMTMNQSVLSKRAGGNEYVKSENDALPTAEMEVWWVDGTLYANRYDGKIKAEVDKEKFLQNFMSKDPAESTLLDIPESWFTGLKFEDKGDYYILSISISAEKYEEYFSLVDLGANVTLTDDVVYNVYFDEDGNLTKITTAIDYQVSAQGITVDCHADSVSEVSFDEFVITPPADKDSYLPGYIPGL